MKKLVLLALLAGLGTSLQAQIWVSRNASIRFFSSAPIEDIEATTQTAQAAINTETGEVYFKASIVTFKFRKPLMEEHFNENYLESDKYPNAEFSGKILELPDLSKDGTYPVNVAGRLTIHGVEKERLVPATLTVSKGKISSNSVFKVRCEDHNIEIPTIVIENIAEELEVTVNCSYTPKSK
ncbi:MAG: YceI family protein [Bacteroidia bacterium]|nr:YceI family protein [Bacteroidia bacterium]